MSDKKYSVASLFCGAGGLDRGFHDGGFQTIWANDFNKDAAATMKKWCTDAEVVCGDVCKIAEKDVPRASVMLGGFPCQSFSSMGARRGTNDPRGVLYREYIRILKTVQPYMFIGENVQGLVTMDNGDVLQNIIKDFADAGYTLYYDLYNAADYGVPQDRKRIIIQGWRNDLDGVRIPLPKMQPRVTMRDALWGKRDPEHDEVHWGPYSPRFMSVNRKRSWDDVSYTILAGARSCPLHPSSPDEIQIGEKQWAFAPESEGITRRFAWWEAALIQTFPEDMEFVGSLESRYRQVGNAVPCKLGEVFAFEIKKELERLGLPDLANLR